MSSLAFSPYNLAGIPLKNRILRSATHEGLADDRRRPSAELRDLCVRLARGGVGGIITGWAGVAESGSMSNYHSTLIDRDEFIPAFRSVADAVHMHGAAIILQVGHAGRQSRRSVTGYRPLAPTAIRDKYYSDEVPREAGEADIRDVIEAFAQAVRRAKEAGFDGVQLHLAHGYLLSEFLSSYMNRRRDDWGGSTERRYRIVDEIFRRARALVGAYPIFVKMNGHDGRPHGMRIQEAVDIARRLEQSGCAGIEVSCGVAEDLLYGVRFERNPLEAILYHSDDLPAMRSLPDWIKRLALRFENLVFRSHQPTRLYNVPAARAVKTAVRIPVVAVGGIRTVDDINSIIDSGQADLVALCRPFILEPDLVSKFQNGTSRESRCISCSYCMLNLEKTPLHCYYGRWPKKAI